MVISRSDAKRRRREGDNLEDTLQGSPKRTKVHAQRKFAQGSSNLSSPALTPVKDKEKVKTNGTVLSPEEKVKTNGTVLSPELIPSKRPKTEDFLTFLCFRGTPILPPQLDFFNVATVPENQDEEQGSSQGDCSSSRVAAVMSAGHKLHRSASTEQSVASSVVKRSDRLRSNAKKKPTTAVQAIRKKYQEQRLAKQRARTLTTLAHKVKRKSVIQTRSSTVSEETRPLKIHKLKAKKQIIKKRSGKIIQTTKKLKTLKYMPLRRISARGRRKARRDLRHHPIRRGGLRSGGQLPPGSEEGLKKEKIQHVRTSLKEKKDKNETNVFASSLSDFSSDDDQPLVKRTRPLEQSAKQKLARKVIKRIVKGSRKVHPHMVTRSRQQTPTPVTATKVSTRPTRKTKEAAALYMELLGKKLITPEAEADEDSLSIDSFPELPNSRRNEQRENEMKARLNKEKNMKLQKLEIQMKKDAKKDVPAQKKDTILQKKGGQIHKDDPKKENAEKLKTEKISGSPSGSEEGKRRLIRPKKEKERKLREVEKVEDAKEKVVKLKDSNKSDDSQGRVMRSMDLDKPGAKGKISKSKDIEGKGNMNKHKESSRIEEIKGRPVRHKGIGIKHEDVAVDDNKLKETDRVEEPKGRTRPRENEEVKRLLKSKVVSRSEAVKKRVKRYKEIEKTNGIKSKLVKSKENNEIEGMMNTDKLGDVEGSLGRVVKSKESDSSAVENTEKVDEGKGRMTKVKEMEKSQEAKDRRTTEKSEDGKPKFVKASNESKQEENKIKVKSDDKVEELKGRSGKNKEIDRVQELKGRTKLKEVDEIESTRGKVVDKIEPAKGKVMKLKDNESIKGRTMRTREIDESKAGSANVKELENNDDSVHKVSQETGGVTSSKMPRTHEDEKGKQKATFKTRVNRKDANVDVPVPKKSKGPKAPLNKRSPAIKKKSVDSEDDNWEDEGEEEVVDDGMKPPIPPRRSLRRGSHDRSQPGSESLDSLTGETATTRSSSRRSSSHSSLSPVGRQIQKSSKSRDSSEDKFSDSDEEPLGKIALKNSSACQKSNDSREEKKHGKDQGAHCKKQPSKDTSESDDNIQGMNSKNKGTKKFLKIKPNSTKILSKPLGEKEVVGKSKSVKTVRESSAMEDYSEKKKPLNSDSKELQVLNKSKNLAGCSKSTGENECFEHDSKKKSALDGKEDESYLSHSIPDDNANDDSSPESGRDSEVNRCEKIVNPILDEDHNTNVIPSKGKGKIPGTKFSTVKESEQSEKVDTQSSETNSDIPGATKNVPFPDSEKKSSSSTGEKERTRGLLSSEKDHSNDGSLTSPVELKTSDKASLFVEKSGRFAVSPESKKSDKSSVSLVAKKLNKRLSFSPERKKIPDSSCASFEKKSSKRVSSSPEDKKIEVKKTGKRLTSSPEGKMLAEKVLVSSEQKKSNKSLSSPHGKKLVNKPPLSPEGKNANKAYCSDGKKTDKSAITSDDKQSLKGLSSPECTKSANKPSSGEKVNRRLTCSPECKKLDDPQHLSLEEGKSQKNLFPSPELKKSSDSSSQSSDKLPLSLYDKSPSDNFPSKDSELCSERPATSDDGYSTDKLCSPSENDGGKLSHLPVIKKTTLQMDDNDSNSKFLASSDGKKTADMLCLLSEENKSNSELSSLSGKKLDETSSLLPEESESSSKLSPLFDGSKSSNTFSILSKETDLSQFSSTLKESKTSSKLPPSPDKLADSVCLQSEEHKSSSSSKKSTDSTSQSFEESSLASKSPEKRELSNKLLSFGEKKPVSQNKTVGDQLPVSEISSNNIPECNEGKRLSGNSLEERISTVEDQLVGSKLYLPRANQEERKQSLSEGKNLANRLSLSPEGKRSGITIPFSTNKISLVPKESKTASRSFSLAVDDKSSDESVLNTEGIPADGKSSERRITDAKESMKNLAVNKLSILSEAEKLMPELPSTSAEESITLSESSLVSIAKKLTPIIPSEKKRLAQKISLLNNLKILGSSDMDKESDRNSFISNYTFPPLKGDVAHDSNSSEIKPRNFCDKNLKDLKSSILEKKEKCDDTLSVLQKSESSFPNSDEGNNSKPEGGHLIVPHKAKKQGSIKPMNQEDPLSVHKLPAGKSAGGLDPEVRKVSRSNVQRREGNTSKKSEGQRKSSMACPKETELELRRRLSMVCLKETDSEPSIESGCEGESREMSSFMIEKESCLRETRQEPTSLTGKVTCQGETGQESSSVIEKELSKEQKLDLKDSDKIPCPGESEVERHKRLIQKAKEELEQRLNSRDVGDVFKLTSSKMSKKQCSEKVVNTPGSVAKHGKFHDAAKKLNQDIPKGSKKEGGAKLTSWTERSQKSVASHNSVGQSESCESQKPSETENERKMLHGPEMMSKGKVDSITNQGREPGEGRTSNAIFSENLMSVLAKPSDSVVDCSLNKRKLIETNDSPDISKSYNLLGELRTHDQLGSILNFYSSQEINVPNINPVQTDEEIQSNHFKNVGKQLQGSHVQVDPSAESISVQATNFEEAAERPMITTVIQDDRVNQRLFFCKEPVLQEGMNKVQNFMANLTNEVLYHRQLNPVHVSARERSLDIISTPSCSQSIMNVHPPKDLSTLGDCKKGRVNERIEKWLSESCSGSLVHKKDCSMIDGSSCKCGVAVSDEEMLLSELPGERLTSDGISSSNDLEESTPRLAKVGCPLLLSDVTGERMYQSEKISALRLDDFKRTLGSECVDKTENKRIAEQTVSSIPTTCSTSNVPVDEVQKTSSLNFMLSSIAQNSIISPATDIHSTVPWQNMKGFSVKNSNSSHEMQGVAVEHAVTLPASDSCDISARKEELYIDRGKNLELVPVLPDLTTQELVKEQVYNQEHSLVEDLSEKSKVSLSSEQISKKALDSSKIETCYNPRTGGKPVQISDRTAEKKSIFQQRRSFLHKTKERKDLTPSANAFSPENESSVYAFETEPESPPVSTPFRSRARDSRTSSTTTSKSEEDLAKLGEEEISSPAVVSLPPPVTVQIIQAERPVMCVAVQSSPTCILPQTCTTSTQSVTSPVASSRTSTSIAVQVNLDSESGLDSSPQGTLPPETALPEPAQRSMECSTQTEVTEEDDDESEGHLFYIPLQQAPTPSQQLIQGVAVKLGTEGPTGPNQRVIMRAKLVTKAPNFSRTSGAAQDGALGMRRSVLGHQHQRPTSMLMMEQKSSYYNSIGMSSPSSSGTYPPVGTVQPTARSRPSTETTSQLRSDATTGTCDSDLKNISSDTELKQPGTKMSKVVTKQGSSVKEKTTEIDTPGPSTSCSTVVTPVKSSATKASKEKSSAVQTSPSTTGKGGSGVKRNFQKGKGSRALDGSCTPSNITTFPSLDSSPQLVEAPTFHPSEKEFQDPLEFIDRIRPVAERFGLCRVVPPSNFKPECKVTDDMRFTAYNQYVHKMLHRWGPNVMEMMAIRKYLATQGIPFTHPPWIGGMEVDLPRLYQTVQSLGGLKEVIEKKRWQRVADSMKIPKSAQDRVTKLDDIYCKYLLPYDTLSPDERQKLFDEVETEWALRESRITSQLTGTTVENPEEDDTGDENEECIVKGRNMPLNAFYRIARNTMSMWFRQPEPPASEVEQEFWRHVTTRTSHVCVHSGSIDSSGWGYGFPCSKNSPFARHPWNLKVLTNNSGSVLRSMGPIMGVTVPTLHVGMVFTTCCWYRDPHGLPWIEYLHTGASKIWYGIPDTYSSAFRTAMSKLVPKYCRNKTIWLPSDTAMVPPSLLVKHGVSLCHTVQEPGQFIVVFPRAFTSSICTGYLVSESVYFAQPSWLTTAEQVFKDIQNSCEPSMFSLERLLFSVASDTRSHVEVLRQVLPMILRIRQQELDYRKQLYNLGLKTSERLPLPEANVKRRKLRPALEEECDYECEMCRANLFVSLVTNSHEEGVYCLPHAIDLLTKKRHHLKYCKLMYTYDQAELNELIQKLQDRIEVKSQKRSQNKYSLAALK